MHSRAHQRGFGIAWIALSLGVLSCKGEVGTPDPDNGGGGIPDAIGVTRTDPCFTPEQSFAWELYGPVFSRCIGCHNEFGLARNVGVSLRLTFPGDPEFAERNVKLLNTYAPQSIDVSTGSMPLLLAKPTKQTDHIGGEVLPPGSPEARLLSSFVDKLRNPPRCGQVPEDEAAVALGAVTLSAPRETYVRAKFSLTGQVATPEEVDSLADTEAMLDSKLDELMATEPFLTRVQEMFADWLKTDAYTSLVRGDDLLGQLRDLPRQNFYQPLCTPELTNGCCNPAMQACCAAVSADPGACTPEANNRAIDAIAREPMELIKHVVRNDLPMTEIVTANYALINPYSAIVYGVSDAQRAEVFDMDPANDATEFKAVPIAPSPLNTLRAGPDGSYPHAGVLTMPSLLVRYPSSTSNQERTRGARVVLERMLGIPVMKLADFSTAKLPPDADLELATQQYAACTACHAAIDPIAGNFRNFGSTGQFRLGTKLPSHLPPAAFLGVVQDKTDTTEPVRWLGKQVASHDRFALGVLMPVMADLIGAPILTPPTDSQGEGFSAKYLAFRLQQLEIQRLRREFAGPAALRLRPLVKTIIKGPFFRAIAAPEMSPTMQEAFGLAGIGPGTLLTPEQLSRKIISTMGLAYRSGLVATGRDMFLGFSDYRLMFGGTDWDATADRYREPNAMAVRIALRTGNEMACLAVPQDFSIKDPAGRKLFRNVTTATTPESGGEAAIRAEIHRLHRLLLNENLPEDSPELKATYDLWASSRAAMLGVKNGSTKVPSRCIAKAAFEPMGAAYPNETHDLVQDDPNATVRSWMAVIAYLLADGKFFLQ